MLIYHTILKLGKKCLRAETTQGRNDPPTKAETTQPQNWPKRPRPKRPRAETTQNPSISSPLLQCTPSRFKQYLSYTSLSIEITDCPASSTSMGLFDLENPLLWMRVPYWGCIFELRSDQGVVSISHTFGIFVLMFLQWNLMPSLYFQLHSLHRNSRIDCWRYQPWDTWHKWRSPRPDHGVYWKVSWRPSPVPPNISRDWTPCPTWFPKLRVYSGQFGGSCCHPLFLP